MFELERGEQPGKAILLQLIVQSTIEVARKGSAAGNLSRFGKQLLFQSQ